MAILHFISDQRYTLDGVIRYIKGRLNKEKEVNECSKHYGEVRYYDALYVNPEYAARDMLLYKKICSKENGLQYKHIVLSLEENELPDYIDRKSEGTQNLWNVFPNVAWAIQKMTQCQLAYAIHTNTKNVHMHVIINSVRLDNGQKLNIDYPFFIKMLNTCNEILRYYRLSEIRGLQGFSRDEDNQIVVVDDTTRKWWNNYPDNIGYLLPEQDSYS